MVERNKFLDKNLEHIGHRLEQSPGAHAVRAETALDESADLAFEIYVEEGEDCVEQHQADTYEQALQCNSGPFGHQAQEERVKPGGSY